MDEREDHRLARELEDIRRMRRQTDAMMERGPSRAWMMMGLSVAGGILFMLAIVFATLAVTGRGFG